MTDNVLIVEGEGHICTVTINRPERRNALTMEVLYRLGDTLRGLDRGVRVVVLRGAGEKAFSSGMDIGGALAVSDEDMKAKGNPIDYGMEGVTGCHCPVIAMIGGAAMGAGCDLAMSCDLRVAGDNARMGINPVKLGRIYHPAGVQRLINVVGLARAKELFYTGRFVDAQTAREMGLVNRVVPAAELEGATYALAQEIADNAPLAVAGTKTIFNRLLRCQRLSAEDEAEIVAILDMAERSEDLKEGTMAFMEKRKPNFQGA